MPDNLFDLTGRVALVTGAASGLGKAMALGLARYGADILANDINGDGLQQTADEIKGLGRKLIAVRGDASDPDDVRRVFETLDRDFGQINILVNDPAVVARSKPEDLALEDWNRVLKVSLTSYFLNAQEAGRRMIRQGKGGSIINISSIAGSSALGRGNFVYSVAKGGINQFTRELAIEWGRHQIRVNAIQPVQMKTPIVKRWLEDPKTDAGTLVPRLLGGIPLGRLGEPEDIVGAAVFLASDASSFITGVLLPLDGGNLAQNAGGTLVW